MTQTFKVTEKVTVDPTGRRNEKISAVSGYI